MEAFLEFYREYWRKILLIALCAVAVYGLFFFRIHTLLPGYNEAEVITQQTTKSLHAIWNNPDYAPYKLILWAGHQVGLDSVLNARLLSAGFGVIAVGLFFYIVKAWFSTRITIVATVLFATSSALLHPARFGAPIILQMSTLVLFAIVLFYQAHRDALPNWLKVGTRYGLALLLLLSLYVPGTIWVLLFGAVLVHRKLFAIIRSQSILNLSILTMLTIVFLTPLFYIGFQNHDFALKMLGLPTSVPSLLTVWQNFIDLGSQLFWRSHIQPALSLIGAPIYEVISMALIFLGLAAQLQKPRLHTNYFLLGSVPIALFLASIGGPVTYVMVVPLLALLMAGGLFYLLDQWLRVFPRNPVARSVGVVFLSILIGFSIFYQIRVYFVAWPNARVTKAAYSLPQL